MTDAPLPIPPGDVERYHAAAVELADEARRIIIPALERKFAVKTKADRSLVRSIRRSSAACAS